MKKVAMKGPMNALRTSLSNFFNMSPVMMSGKGYMSYLFTMSPTNVSLSAEELSLVTDASWIRMKQEVIRKVYEMFALSAEDINRCFAARGVYDLYRPAMSSPKISRGENYQGLPYVILDHPRDFGKDDVFSLRTFFWWGNFFSISVHLEGRFRKIFMERSGLSGKLPEGLFICVHETPWQHYFEPDNLIPFDATSHAEMLTDVSQHSFLKFSLRYDLDKWNHMQDLLREGYEKMADWLV
jgi:hypothetical protein